MAKTILVIEDERNLIELLKFRLKTNGYNVKTALDGEEGLRKVKKYKPDLVLLDVTIPKMHGYDVCKAIKQNRITKDIPIIILTARLESEDKKGSQSCGADFFIGKPFEPKELLKEIKKLIA